MADDKQTERLTSGGDEILLGDTAVLTRLDKAIAWAANFRYFPIPSRLRAARWSTCRSR
ncbi:MAG TPA: hypothetical protein VKV03_03865 [Candidatus Binataceae bacterium]|nr:hypothetical protein [Candidatus Binataceae bacterium]